MKPVTFSALLLFAALTMAGPVVAEPDAAAGVAEDDQQQPPPPPEVARLIEQWGEQNSLCRGLHGDDPRMQPACDERQQLGRALDAQGWCYGKQHQYGYQMVWHPCEADSWHYE